MASLFDHLLLLIAFFLAGLASGFLLAYTLTSAQRNKL